MVSSTKYSASSSEPSPATAATAAAAAAAAVRTAALFAPPLTSSSHAPKVPTGPGTSGGANNSGDICSAGRHNNHHNNNNFDNSDMLFTHHHHHHHHPPSALAHRLEGAGFYDPFPLPSHTHSSLSPADLLVPSSSSSSSKSWPQELEKRTLGFFSNNKILDLLGIAAGILLLDGIARWRLRLGWALFCIFSLVTLTTELSRSVRSGTLLVLYTASLSVVLFAVLQWTFLYPLLPPLANMFVYGYVIGSTRGYEAMYWALWSALITVDTLVRTSPVSDLEACAGAHCISFGSFLLLKEIVTVIAERRNLTLETRKLASGELRIYSLYDQESASSSPPSPPSSERKYAYSNWNCKTNRFELCLEKLAQNFAIVSWTLPQSLILTLRDSIQRCYQSNRTQNSLRKSRRVVNLEPLVEPYFPYNLLKSNSALRAVDESWDREDTFGTPTIRGSRVVAVPYAPLLSSTLQSSPPTSADILIPSSAGFNASNTPADSCLCLPHLGFGTSLFISQSDIHVLVNGKPWTRGLASSLAEGLIAISDLEEGFDYEVVVSIRGYCSIPLRIHTAGKPPLPARRESKVEPIDQIPAAAANGDASSADSDSIDRRERISSMKAQIDGLRASHRTHVAELRKLRKAIAKSLAGYRSEIEAVQKQISKEAANDVRFRQRIQTLSEQLRSATEAEASAKQELERLESGRKAALVEVSQMEVKLESAKVALKKSSDQATANGLSNKSSVEADLTAIDAKLEDLRTQLKSLESEDRVVRQHTIPKLKNLLEKALSRKQQLETADKAAALRVEVEIGKKSESIHTIRAACEVAKVGNQQVKMMIDDVLKLNEGLYSQLQSLQAATEKEDFMISEDLRSSSLATGKSDPSERDPERGPLNGFSESPWKEIINQDMNSVTPLPTEYVVRDFHSLPRSGGSFLDAPPGLPLPKGVKPRETRLPRYPSLDAVLPATATVAHQSRVLPAAPSPLRRNSLASQFLSNAMQPSNAEFGLWTAPPLATAADDRTLFPPSPPTLHAAAAGVADSGLHDTHLRSRLNFVDPAPVHPRIGSEHAGVAGSSWLLHHVPPYASAAASRRRSSDSSSFGFQEDLNATGRHILASLGLGDQPGPAEADDQEVEQDQSSV